MYNTPEQTYPHTNKRRNDEKKRRKNEYFKCKKEMEAKILFEVVKNLKFNTQILNIHYLNYKK